MAKVLLVDADSTIPNLALMKLSTYHKSKGDEVSLEKLDISYYPKRKKKKIVNCSDYDLVCMSMVFDNKEYVSFENVSELLCGGTGWSLDVNLPNEVANSEPDYTLYPDNDTSYGFLTRGCNRNCDFCVVFQKEGKLRQVAEVKDIVRHDQVKFLDNNILGLPGHEKILAELAEKKVKCQFNQGLDIRYLNEESACLLSKMNYWGEYFFAFDRLKDEKLVAEKLTIFRHYIEKDWAVKMFLYCHPTMSIKNDVFYRVIWCKAHRVLPYFMRDISCWGTQDEHVYTDLAAWCNQPNIFKKLDWGIYLERRHPKNPERVKRGMDACYGRANA